MFWTKNKKNRYTPAYLSFTVKKWGLRCVFIARTCFPDDGKTQHVGFYEGMNKIIISYFNYQQILSFTLSDLLCYVRKLRYYDADIFLGPKVIKSNADLQ